MTRRQRLARILDFAQRRWSRACGRGCHNVCELRQSRGDTAAECDTCRRARQWRDVVHRLETAGFADVAARAAAFEIAAWGNDETIEKPAASTPKFLECVDTGSVPDMKRIRLQRADECGFAPEETHTLRKRAA